MRKILECTWYEVYNPLVTGEDKFANLSECKGVKSLYCGFGSSCKMCPHNPGYAALFSDQ